MAGLKQTLKKKIQDTDADACIIKSHYAYN